VGRWVVTIVARSQRAGVPGSVTGLGEARPVERDLTPPGDGVTGDDVVSAGDEHVRGIESLCVGESR
jgi:hypothetical protein